MIEELTKERDQLMNTAADLREKLNEATVAQQDIEAQKETAVEKILKVDVGYTFSEGSAYECG